MATRTCRKGQPGRATGSILGGSLGAIAALHLGLAAPIASAAIAPEAREARAPIEVAGPASEAPEDPSALREGPAPADARADAGSDDASSPGSDGAGDADADVEVQTTGKTTAKSGLPTRHDPGAAPLQVAIGLGPSAAGSKEEQAIVRDLEATLKASSSPKMTVRRLRSGASEPRSICRQRRDDLVIVVDYLPEREAPVLLPYDCSLDQALGIRGAPAAREPGLGAVLWDEHGELVRRGAQERRAPLIGVRTRRFLIAGGAIVALGVALGFIISATLRADTVVVTVSP